MQRNFIAWYLKHRGEKDAAIVAYHTDGLEDWRFSYVRMDYRTEQEETGKVRVKTDLTPARRYSFLVGMNEPNHTAQQQLLPILMDDRSNPTLVQLEKAFTIESVTREFFERYKELFLKLKEELDSLVGKDSKIGDDFTNKNIQTADFAKKLLGQIVFLYFLQKKGWLGVGKDEKGNFCPWGTGPKDFLRRLYGKKIVPYDNFFNDLLEPLFYEALATDRGEEAYYSRFRCKIPFLNGGLFEPIGGYNWQEADILIRNETLGEVFDTFDLYNFTVREDEPLEKEVAVDPEMLGKVFENLLEVRDRKSKGAFYTPREIVHHMCRESLIRHLDGALNNRDGYVRLGVPQTELFGPRDLAKPDGRMELMAASGSAPIPVADLRLLVCRGEFGIEHDLKVDEKGRETKAYSWKLPESIRANAERIDQALADIKICDPAIGSGAFPVGMLHEIVRARETLATYLPDDPDRTTYHFKRHAIQESIYGVDIDCGAVDIAKLRLWLSLVVDEDDFLSIKPLPNLDYKIVCGDSLLRVERNLLNSHLFEELETLKQQFFEEINPRQKKEEKKRIEQLIRQITDDDDHFDFEIYFSEVFHTKKGFDVVIGNPPYLGFQGISKRDKQHYGKLYASAKGKYDLYILFIERSYHLLNDIGYFSFICPTSFTKRDYGDEIRLFLLRNVGKMSLIDFEHTQIFEKATNYTGIFSFSKSKTDDLQFEYRVAISGIPKLIRRSELNSKPWVFTDDVSLSIIHKMKSRPLLGQIAAISEGAVTGLNELYLLNSEDINRHGFECKYFMPCLRGKDIVKYHHKECNEFLFYPYHKVNGRTVPISEEAFRLACPKYYSHLWANIKLIQRREYFIKSSKRWFELWNQRGIDNFTGWKIVTPELSASNRFALAEPNIFYGDTVCGIIVNEEYKTKLDLKYLLGILNSSLIQWYYRKTTVPKAGGFYIYKVMFLKDLPICITTKREQEAIASLVDKILSSQHTDIVNKLISKIDCLVFQYYGLDNDDIQIIFKELSEVEQ
ncbi:MAG: TaqI-like C-terminal specificity domain-containing protein [Desulfobacterales bacterium]|nr:TaqI-like C-terminal specificity domain-containing protein [Desulfobacterales bacterium]